MKKILFAGIAAAAFCGAPAFASDMPTKPPVNVAASYDWTGFYVGGQMGAGWGTVENTLGTNPGGLGPPVGTNFGLFSPSGFLGGGQIGYNWQTGWVVVGVEGDFDGTDIKGSGSGLAPGALGANAENPSGKNNWLATASGRVGGVVFDRLLVYVKGGGAWLNIQGKLTDISGLYGPAGASYSTTTQTWAGWLVGMGTEYAFTRNWSGFIEYNYMDFGRQNINFVLPAGTLLVNSKEKLSVMKAGLNYKF
jgi:outer membrane immunogenic protein